MDNTSIAAAKTIALLLLVCLSSCTRQPNSSQRPNDQQLAEEVIATTGSDDAELLAGTDGVSWLMASRPNLNAAGIRFFAGMKSAAQPTWASPIPGRGHSTPIVVGHRVFVTTADETTQHQLVWCIDRNTGVEVWRTVVLKSGFPAEKDVHQDASHASPTPAADEATVYAVFLNQDRIVATGLDFDGRMTWQNAAGSFRPYMGYSSSPAILGGRLIVSGDDADGGFISALRRSNGEVLWRKMRSKGASHSSPTVMKLCGEDQIVLTGLNTTNAYSPRDGSLLWQVDGPADTTVSTGVSDGQRLFVSGGYPQPGIMCINVSRSQAGWTASVAWTDKTKVYVPSLLLTTAGLFGVTDNGVAMLWSKESGSILHRLRLGGDFYSSPVQHGEFIYLASRGGVVHVLTIDGNTLREDATIDCGGEIMSTPVVTDQEMLLRVAQNRDGLRKEFLYSFRGQQ